MQKKAVVLLVVGLVGLAMVIAGGVLIGTKYFDKMIHNKVEESVPLKEGSSSFDNWKNPDADIYMQFWLFNIKNPLEIKNGSKPVVEEMGPYTYREVREKDNITFLHSGELLEYREPKSYILDLEKSVGDPRNTTITSIDLLALTIASMLQYENSLVKSAVAEVIRFAGMGLFTEHTVHELLWGYPLPTVLKIIKDILKDFGISVPLPDEVGLFTGDTANGTDDGMYRIFTGTGNLDDYNTINTWKGNNMKHRKSGSLSYWTTEYCNMINGTDGTGWHPFLNKSQVLYIFSTDICRSIDVNYNHTYDFHDIPLYRFVPPASVFADHIANPNNTGFCTPNNNSCMDAGVLNVTVCKGAPLIVSQPHFFQGAQRYIDGVEGLHPSIEHQTYIDVEPMTGASLSLAKKLQINADVRNYGILDMLAKMNDTVFPVVWVNESAVATDHGVSKFKSAVTTPIKVTEGVKYGLIALGAFIMLVVLIIALYIFVIKPRRDGGAFLTTQVDDDEDEPIITA